MAENSSKKKEFNADDRFRYLGFDVQPGKLGEFFANEAEKETWVKRVQEKRKGKSQMSREHSTLTKERVAGYERIVMTVTSVLLVCTLFMPWFSGYHEEVIETPVVAAAPVGGDSTAVGAGTPEAARDEAGFTTIMAGQKRKEVRREYQSMSALGALASIGDVGGKVFSSGFILMLTGFLILVYILLCLGLAGYTLYLAYGLKGDPDQKAVQMKKGLRLNWLPVAMWGFMLLISFVGADYSFSTKDMIAQLGDSYTVGTYLGLLSYGFYISLACFIMNAVKAVEI